MPFVAPEELERRLGVRFQLRLGANESAFGPSPRAQAAMRTEAERASRYGDPRSIQLRERLAALHGTAPENIGVAGGIDELLSLFSRLFLDPGDPAVTTRGGYPTFEFGATATGARLVRVPYQDDRPDLDALAEAVRAEAARLVYLANPDNPSGALLPPDEIAAFRARLPEGCLLLLDEAYADFVPPKDLPTFSPDDFGVVRLRTFSKAHGLAGLRIGYALAHPEAVAALDRIRLHFGVNAVAQAAALASLEDPDHLTEVVAATARGRERLADLGAACGLRPLPSATNFVLLDAGTRDRAERLLDALLRRGVFVRKPGQPPLDHGVRITVGTEGDLDRLAEVLPLALSEV